MAGRLALAAALILTCWIAPAQAQIIARSQGESIAASPALVERIAQLPAILNDTKDFDAYFAPMFKAQVSREKLDAVIAQLSRSAGPAHSARIDRLLTPDAATLLITTDNGMIGGRIAVDPAAPHAVTGLLLTGFTSSETSLDAVRAAIAGLHGKTGFAFARLGEDAPQLLAADQADERLAVGSAFKLLILAELIRATNAGERHWDDPVTIDGLPLPAGDYTGLQKGAQLPLATLAGRMISVSDNSATDLLLRVLGRERVEAMMMRIGVAHPERNRPLLSTLDMFRLKGVPGLAGAYRAKSAAGRRAMLDTEIAAIPPSAIDPALFKDGKPVLIDEFEWFFTASDLVRIMDWIRRNSETPQGATARTILSANPGIGGDGASAWSFVGYKGGSEPGVMNMTLLLRAKDGQWYAMAASWNDPARDVEQLRLVGLMTRAAQLAAPR